MPISIAVCGSGERTLFQKVKHWYMRRHLHKNSLPWFFSIQYFQEVLLNREVVPSIIASDFEFCSDFSQCNPFSQCMHALTYSLFFLVDITDATELRKGHSSFFWLFLFAGIQCPLCWPGYRTGHIVPPSQSVQNMLAWSHMLRSNHSPWSCRSSFVAPIIASRT